MITKNYLKLRSRIAGALSNAIIKDPAVDKGMLDKAFKEACQTLIKKGKLSM